VLQKYKLDPVELVSEFSSRLCDSLATTAKPKHAQTEALKVDIF